MIYLLSKTTKKKFIYYSCLLNSLENFVLIICMANHFNDEFKSKNQFELFKILVVSIQFKINIQVLFFLLCYEIE